MTAQSVDLFTPFELGHLRLPNRVVMAPMLRCRASSEGVPGALMADYYAQRAEAALIIAECASVAPEGRLLAAAPGIHNARQAAGWSRVARAVHGSGGRIFLQLGHAGRIADRPRPVAPSPLAAPSSRYRAGVAWRDFPIPRALTIGELPALVGRFRQAAARAFDAGFDGIELQAGSGQLLDQFLQDVSNRRDDGYGGGPAGRSRLLLEVVAATAEVWPLRQVGVRLSPAGRRYGMGDSDPAGTFRYLVRQLDRAGVGYIGLVEAEAGERRPGPRQLNEPTWQLHGEIGAALMSSGGYDRETASDLVGAGIADLVAFGKAFIANPDLSTRLRLNAPLNRADPATYFQGDARGYTDYPRLRLN